MGTVYIYTLTEKGTDEVKYVGQTNDLRTRLLGHISSAPVGTSRKSAWIKSVIDGGREIEIHPIEECSEDNANERELYWMSYYSSSGCELTNTGKSAFRRSLNKAAKALNIPVDIPMEDEYDLEEMYEKILLLMAESLKGSVEISNLAVTRMEKLMTKLEKQSKEIIRLKGILSANGIDVDLFVGIGDGI